MVFLHSNKTNIGLTGKLEIRKIGTFLDDIINYLYVSYEACKTNTIEGAS